MPQIRNISSPNRIFEFRGLTPMSYTASRNGHRHRSTPNEASTNLGVDKYGNLVIIDLSLVKEAV